MHRPSRITRRILYLCLAAHFCVESGAAEEARQDSVRAWLDLPDVLAHNYGVIGLEVYAAAPDTLAVRRTRLGSPAAAAGLREGDLLLGADQYRLRTREHLSSYTKSLAPGSAMVLHLRRGDSPLDVQCAVTDRRHLYYLMNELGRLPVPPGDHPWVNTADSLERAARRLTLTLGADGGLDALEAAFAVEASQYGADCRLAHVDFILHHPLKAGALVDGLAAELAGSTSFAGLLRAAGSHLGAGAAAAPPAGALASRHPIPSELARLALDPLLRAGRLVELALAHLDSSERVFLRSQVPVLLERFGSTHSLDRGAPAETEAHVRVLRLAKEVDVGLMLAAARELAPFTTATGRRDLRRAARRLDDSRLPADLPQAISGEVLFAAETEWGWLLIGGEGDNYYGADALLILDLGGDDTYANNAGSPGLVAARRGEPDPGEFAPPAALLSVSPVGAVIDLGGDDRYLARGPGSGGAAIGGVGLLVDVTGHDLYQGDLLTQGAAFCGVGALIDEAGDDTYLGGESAQAAAYFGVSLLWDRKGDDLYSASQFSQGFGGAGSLSVLLDDRGRDRYVADRSTPSSYGTPGVYNGWSQGVGCGFRGYASGGIGLLIDRRGNDEYQAGNFSQGLGYFFGLGGLVDDSGDDRYIGTRYTQGASAHQAIGVLIDRSGNDRYSGSIAANQGGAWDVGIAILDDRGGDDQYRAEGFAQGAASMNGLGILLDRGGRDRYTALSGQGSGGSTSYWGGREAGNLGLLIDTGGETDQYSLPERYDDTETRRDATGISADD